MLSNAYFLAKFRFDTAANEPAKNLQKIAKNNLQISEDLVHDSALPVASCAATQIIDTRETTLRNLRSDFHLFAHNSGTDKVLNFSTSAVRCALRMGLKMPGTETRPIQG